MARIPEITLSEQEVSDDSGHFGTEVQESHSHSSGAMGLDDGGLEEDATATGSGAELEGVKWRHANSSCVQEALEIRQTKTGEGRSCDQIKLAVLYATQLAWWFTN